jgi:hypothetical protein
VEEISSQLTSTNTFDNQSLWKLVPSEQHLNISLPIPYLYTDFGNPSFSGHYDFWMATLPRSLSQNSFDMSNPLGSDPVNLIADVYLVYFPTCAATNNKFGSPTSVDLTTAQVNISNWKAFKGTFNMCVKSFTSSTINGVTNTSDLQGIHNEPWRLSDTCLQNVSKTGLGASSVIYYPDPLNIPPSTGRLPYSVDALSLHALADVMRLTLNGSAQLTRSSVKQWASPEQIILVQDVFGADPQVCRISANMGIQGFRSRLENIAVSLTKM